MTPGESETLARQTTEQIALELNLARDTVHTHVRNAIQGLKARNRVHAVALVARRRRPRATGVE